MKALVQEMREGLARVTPGPWYQTDRPWYTSGDGVVAGSPDGNIAIMVCDCDDWAAPREEYEGPYPVGDKEADAAHIARCHPGNIRALANVFDAMLAALKRADQFITNGVELGYIRLPDASLPDPAHETPGIIRAAIAKAEAES